MIDAGSWVQISYKIPKEDDQKRKISKIYNYSDWQILKGNVLLCVGMRKNSTNTIIVECDGRQFFMHTDWITPVKKESVQRLLSLREEIFKGKRIEAYQKKRLDDSLRDIFHDNKKNLKTLQRTDQEEE